MWEEQQKQEEVEERSTHTRTNSIKDFFYSDLIVGCGKFWLIFDLILKCTHWKVFEIFSLSSRYHHWCRLKPHKLPNWFLHLRMECRCIDEKGEFYQLLESPHELHGRHRALIKKIKIHSKVNECKCLSSTISPFSSPVHTAPSTMLPSEAGTHEKYRSRPDKYSKFSTGISSPP